jgi:hypothetical protein
VCESHRVTTRSETGCKPGAAAETRTSEPSEAIERPASPMRPESALIMAMRNSDQALANRLISQYEMLKHLCDRLTYTQPWRCGTALNK